MNGVLQAAMKNAIFNIFIKFGFDIGRSQELEKHVFDNNRQKTFFAVMPQIKLLNGKYNLVYLDIKRYKELLDNILEEYPENMFEAPSLTELNSY
jgi:hypothetical protein